MTESSDLLGVRVKLYLDGRVKIIMYRLENGKPNKYYLDNDGNWQKCPEGFSPPPITKVYRQTSDPGIDE